MWKCNLYNDKKDKSCSWILSMRNNRIIRGSKDLVNRFLNASPDDLLNDIVELCFM